MPEPAPVTTTTLSFGVHCSRSRSMLWMSRSALVERFLDIVLDHQQHPLNRLKFLGRYASHHLPVHLLGYRDHTPDHLPALVGNVDALGAAILGIGPALDLAAAFKPITETANSNLATLHKPRQVYLHHTIIAYARHT